MKKPQILLSSLFFATSMALANTPQAPVNINKADTSALAAVPGIGKHKADAIVKYRQSHGPFKNLHDLTKVKGISEKKLENILKHNPPELSI